MTVVHFPAAPIRAFHISAADQAFVGRYVGSLSYDGVTRTEQGPLDLVVAALVRPENRCGLPIIAPPEAVAAAMQPGALRPYSWRRVVHGRTDCEKYQEALSLQRLRDGSSVMPRGDGGPAGGWAA